MFLLKSKAANFIGTAAGDQKICTSGKSNFEDYSFPTF